MSEFEEDSLDYQPPVDELLFLGDDGLRWTEPFDYEEEFGVSGEHVPELLRMAVDRRLHEGESDSPHV